MRRLVFVAWCLVLVAALLSGCTAQQASYPSGPVELTVPQTAGSAPDLAARLVAEWLTKKWRQPVNVVNRPGGGMVVGTQYVMQAKPDGYAMLFDGNGASSFQAMVKDALPYRWDERTFVARVADAPMVFFVNGSSPMKNLKDVEQRIKSDPASFKTSWQAITTVTGVSLVKWFDAIKVNPASVKTVEYTASNEAVAAVAGGHIDFGSGGISTVLPMLGTGKVRIVAVLAEKRTEALPDAPTAKEQGYDLVQSFWQGVSGPPELPQPVVDRWASTLSEIAADKEFAATLQKSTQMYPAFLGPKEFREMVLAEGKSVEGYGKR